MFYDLGNCTRIEHKVLKILYGALMMAKGYKVCGLYTLDYTTIISHTSVVSKDEFTDEEPY